MAPRRSGTASAASGASGASARSSRRLMRRKARGVMRSGDVLVMMGDAIRADPDRVRLAIAQGIRTLSMTWITPFDWFTLAIETVAVPPLASVIAILSPFI